MGERRGGCSQFCQRASVYRLDQFGKRPPDGARDAGAAQVVQGRNGSIEPGGASLLAHGFQQRPPVCQAGWAGENEQTWHRFLLEMERVALGEQSQQWDALAFGLKRTPLIGIDADVESMFGP